MKFFLNVFLYIKFKNVRSGICLKCGSNIFCMKSMSNFMFCLDINYGDIMFYEFNFWKLCFFYFGSSAMSTGIIVDIIRPLSTGIMIDIHILLWRM